MPYERSSLISRAGYSGLGATRLSPQAIAAANAAQQRVLYLSNFGDAVPTVPPPVTSTALTDTLTSTPVLVGAAVAAYFMFRKKR